MSLLRTLRFIMNHPLNREYKFGAVRRFVRWQLASRLAPGAIVVDWVNGARLLARSGETGVTGNIYTGLHEFADMAFVLHFLRQEDLFVDVGANVGSYTVLACAAAGARGLAFEPVPGTFERLRENIRINHLDKRVIAVCKGVGAKREVVKVTKDRNTTNRVLMDDELGYEAVDVDVVTLDTFLQAETPNMIKIDVEGWETPVLEGARKMLEKQDLRAVVMELNGSGRHFGYDEEKILSMMFECGFQTFSYDPFERKLENLNGKNLLQGNTLFLRDIQFVVERVETAGKVSIFGRDTRL